MLANRKRMVNRSKNNTFVIGVALGGVIAGIVIGAFLFSGVIHNPETFNFEFDSATTITLVLTALSIILTALGIIIAVVGAFGFGMLKTEAFKAAAEHANEQLGEDGELRRIIETRVDQIVARSQSGRTSSVDLPNPESEYGE